MPRALFDQTLASAPARRKKPLGTILISIGLHLMVLGVVVTLQVTDGLNTPLIASHLPAFVVAAPLPVPPAVTPVRASPAAAVTPVDTVPLEAPDRVVPDPPTPTVPATPTLGRVIGTDGGIGVDALGAIAHITAAPPPESKGPMPVGGKILPPVRLDRLSPQYPDIARVARVEGDVVLEATIDETGAVTHVVVKHSVPLLDAAAIAAVSRWRYSPTKLNGQAVAVTMLVTVRFSLHE
jgi:protein TonB